MSGSISANVIRVTLLDANGAPATGANVYGVSKGFISIAVSPRYTDPFSTVMTDIWGEVVVNHAENPELTGIGLGLVLAGVDPALVGLLAEGCTRIDRSGIPVGLRMRAGRYANARYALETWTDAIDGPDTCGEDQWHYWVYPKVRAGALSAWTFDDGPLAFGLSGAAEAGLASWGDGPFTPAPSDEVVTTGDFAVHTLTSIPPPSPTAGLGAL